MIFNVKSKRFIIVAVLGVFVSFSTAYSLPWSFDMWSQDSIQPFEEPVVFPQKSVTTDGKKVVLEDREKVEQIKVNPIPVSKESLEKGQELFKYNCIICHGPEGKGDGPIVKKGLGFYPLNLAGPLTVNRTDGFIYAYIRYGGKVMMPAYSENISETDAWHVVNYVRKLQGK